MIIQGSSTLYPRLLSARLIDRLVLMTFPVILGSGKRWFGDGTPAAAMRIVEHQVTQKGVVIAAYRPEGAVQIGDFGAEQPSAVEIERQKKVEQGTW
jgi:dihydrofolate reductase